VVSARLLVTPQHPVDLVRDLRRLLRLRIAADKRTNSIILVGAADNMRSLQELIAQLDMPAETDLAK